MENLGNQTGTTDISTNNRTQEMDEKILGVEDTIEQRSIGSNILNLQFS